MNKNKMGKITVTESCLKPFWDTITEFIPLEIHRSRERLEVIGTITYVGTHPQFKELKEGDIIPEYYAITEFDEKNIKYTTKIELID